ncbi:hypothetical protein IOK49_01940 [Fervidicoccus fontis]|uniref:Uncharacterized protein n=1 Tax=Fervidicoccus fontis TaxID=683846 RepID=A0A843ACL9_9CREN|nr:hypothetical protein [Fervidicoccus fontis]MBE9390846.1 hypothetical protein [Fervidicoccus fontis]
MRQRGISTIVVGIALSLVLIATALYVIPWLEIQSERAQSSISPSSPTISAFAFYYNGNYQVIVYNYGIKSIPKAYIIYNTTSGANAMYSLGYIPAGSYVIATIPGCPIAYSDNLGNTFGVEVVNIG